MVLLVRQLVMWQDRPEMLQVRQLVVWQDQPVVRQVRQPVVWQDRPEVRQPVVQVRRAGHRVHPVDSAGDSRPAFLPPRCRAVQRQSRSRFPAVEPCRQVSTAAFPVMCIRSN